MHDCCLAKTQCHQLSTAECHLQIHVACAAAEIMIGDTRIMCNDHFGDGAPNQCSAYVYVPDVDATAKLANDNGAAPLLRISNLLHALPL